MFIRIFCKNHVKPRCFCYTVSIFTEASPAFLQIFFNGLLMFIFRFCRANRKLICLWSERAYTSDTSQPFTLSISAPEHRVRSRTSLLFLFCKMGVFALDSKTAVPFLLGILRDPSPFLWYLCFSTLYGVRTHHIPTERGPLILPESNEILNLSKNGVPPRVTYRRWRTLLGRRSFSCATRVPELRSRLSAPELCTRLIQ